jgi:thiamine pyrophosphokinase
MKKVIFIISGGALDDPVFLERQVVQVSPAAVICADGGASHLRAAGITPTLIVGDMDSLDEASEKRYREMGSRIIRHPRRKDETDTELALADAFELAPAEVWIWGAMGNRIDHTLANISLLVQGVDRGIEVKLIDSWCEVFLVARRTVLRGEEGQTVSLFPFGGDVAGVTLAGFEYPLTNAVMSLGRPHGISNRLTAKEGVIEVDTGYLLVVRYFRPGVFPGEGGR